jgi:diguanylate cyclase
MVETLLMATDQAQLQNQSLEKRLEVSTAEVEGLKEHLEQVRRDATTDGLTNLANRNTFAHACAVSDHKGTSLSLALLDIDHFKSFNGTWGHQTGDQVIRFVASVIDRLGSSPRFAARYGGEEFAMIFPSESAEVIEAALEEIRV